METTKEEYIKDLISSLENVKYIMPDDIPNIDLYMDQVTTFMDKHLKSSKRYSEDKLLTKTMINNYTKNELLPPPNKKKYSKEHMFLLIFIYYFKNILSINDIQSIFNPLTERYYKEGSSVKLETIYDEIFRLEKEQNESLTKDIVRKMTKAQEAFEGVTDQGDHDFLTTFSFISMLCFDVYMRKHMIEKMIDDCLMGESFKRNTGEVKKPETKKEAKPASKPAAKAAVKTASKTAGKTVVKPASKSVSKPTSKPVSKTANKPSKSEL